LKPFEQEKLCFTPFPDLPLIARALIAPIARMILSIGNQSLYTHRKEIQVD